MLHKIAFTALYLMMFLAIGVTFDTNSVAEAKSKGNSPQISFSTLFGASAQEFGIEVATDSAGATIFVGSTASTDFPILNPIPGGDINKGGSARFALPAGHDAYVAKFSKNGDLVFSTFLGGTDGELALGVTTDKRRNIYVTGYTASTDFPVLNAFQPDNAGDEDSFLTKLDPQGNLVYSTYLGGSAQDRAQGVAVDKRGNVFVHGQAASLDFPTLNAFQDTHAGGYNDATLTVFSKNGSEILASTYFGGTGDENGFSVKTDKRGDAYFVGRTTSSDMPTVNAVQSAFGGESDIYVGRVNKKGKFKYLTYVGGSSDDGGFSGIGASYPNLDVSSKGEAVITGTTFSSDYPVTDGSGSLGSADIFVTLLSKNGAKIKYSTILGGAGFDRGQDVQFVGGNKLVVIARTHSVDLPVSANALQATHAGGGDDLLIAQIDIKKKVIPYLTYLGGTGDDDPRSAVVSLDNQLVIVGHTTSTDLPMVDPFLDTYTGTTDVFLMRLKGLNKEIRN